MLCTACSGNSNDSCATPDQCAGARERDRLRRWFDRALNHSMLKDESRVQARYNTGEFLRVQVEES